MKKFIVLTAMMLLVSTAAFAALSGSAHDLRTLTGVTNTQMCQPCHVPHNAPYSAAGPLWNHAASTTAATGFTMYTSATGTLDSAVPATMSAGSYICLGCHDGTTALDSFGAQTGGATTITTTAMVGNGATLADDHPISFVYDETLAIADGELVTPASLTAVIPALPLFGGTGLLECATCHDVHNGTTAATIGIKLLNVTPVGSALCIACHQK